MDFLRFIRTDILETLYHMFGYESHCEDSIDRYGVFVNTLIDRAPEHMLKCIYYLIEYHINCVKHNKPFEYTHIYRYVEDFLEISFVAKNKKITANQTIIIELSASFSTNLILTAMNNSEFLRRNKYNSLFTYVDSIS